jgi:FixJ family two-component response regulator
MNEPRPATVHVVDDDKSFRTAICRLIEASGFRSASYGSGDEFLTRLADREPGCVLVDLQMPSLHGLELQERLAEKAPLLPVIFLTGHGDVPASVRAMKAGAADFLEKPVSGAVLLEAVRRALADNERRRTAGGRLTVLRARVAALTARESHVFRLMVRGKRNKQIAYELAISERTVKAHRQKVMEKLAARSFAETVSIAAELGLADQGEQTQP